jgi:hypothetical protein
VYLGIVKTEWGSPRLSRDLIWVCNLCMQILDASGGAFAITSLRVLFTVLGVQLLLLLHVHCTSGMVIVRSEGCCESGTVIPLFKNRCSADD